jgi:hypothetical protein
LANLFFLRLHDLKKFFIHECIMMSLSMHQTNTYINK